MVYELGAVVIPNVKAPRSPLVPSSTNLIGGSVHSVDSITSVDVLALAVAAITQQGLPSMVGISCVHPFNADVGDKLALANVYVTSAVGIEGSVAPRLYNNIVALFKPSCPSPPPENTHCVPSQRYILLPSIISIQISPTVKSPVGSPA